MARMTNFRSAAIATGNAIDESAYDNVKVVADSINKITEIANFITEHDVDLSALSTILNKLGTSTSEQLATLAELDLKQFVKDLAKGNYLGNRKIDINLALNIKGITETLIEESPQEAEDLWTNNSQNVMYDKATITFVDGTVVTLPFLLDSNPTVVTNSYGLLVQFDRNDAVKAVAQEDLIYSFDVQYNTTYTVEINNIHYTYTTGGNATRGEIVTGLTNQINSGSEPWTAYNEIDNIRIKADTAGEAFVASVGINMLIRTDVENVTAGNYPTKFLNKLKNTSFNSFTLDSISNTIRFYDVIGSSSNIERIQLHTTDDSTNYIEKAPVYYWAKTTSALEVLSARTRDVIKLGNEISNIKLLANSISQILEVQDRLPELIDTYIDGKPQGDLTIYNRLDKLDALYQELNKLIAIYPSLDNISTVSDNITSVDIDANNIEHIKVVSGALTSGKSGETGTGGQYYGNGIIKAVGFVANATIVNDSINIASGTNAFAIDQITITDGTELIVEDNAVFKVL